MAKYKKVNEGILDKFISSVFGAIGRGAHSRALKHLSKKDPVIANQIKTIEKNRKELAKMLKRNVLFKTIGWYFDCADGPLARKYNMVTLIHAHRPCEAPTS